MLFWSSALGLVQFQMRYVLDAVMVLSKYPMFGFLFIGNGETRLNDEGKAGGGTD